MGMLIKKDWEEDRGKMNFLKLAGVSFGTISCLMAVALAVLLGWYFWNVAGNAVAAIVGNVIVLVGAAVVGMVFSKIVAKTNGKFGKCRPFMVMGNVLMIIGGALVVCFTHKLPEAVVIRSIYFYVFGGAFFAGMAIQLVAWGTGLKCLPAEKSSPVITAVCSVVFGLVFSVVAFVLAQSFAKNGGYSDASFCIAAWNYLTWTGLVSMVIFVASIAGRDSNQYYNKD